MKTTWIHHFLGMMTFLVLGTILDVPLSPLILLFSFMWCFLAVHAFFVEPLFQGIWLYRRLETQSTPEKIFFCELLKLTAWHLFLILPFVLLQEQLSSDGLRHVLILTALSAGLNALIVVLGPLVGQDRQAPWLFSILLIPLTIPLMLTAWIGIQNSDAWGPIKLLGAISLVYMLLGTVFFSYSLRSVDS